MGDPAMACLLRVLCLAMGVEPYLYTPYTTRLAALGFAGRRIRKVPVNGGFTCPNLDGSRGRGGCTFCDNRSFSPVAGSRGTSVSRQLEAGTGYFRERLGADGFIAYFQTFSGTYAPVERLRSLYEEALAFPGVVGLSVGTRPDCLDPEAIDLLDEMAQKVPVTLELGLQSAFDETLRRINRGHGFAEFAEAMDRTEGRRFDRCVHVILGLPGEGPPHYRETAAALGRWRYEGIKIHPLHVVRGTVLAKDFAAGRYRPPELAEYVEALADFLERIPPGVAVQRFTGDAGEDLLLAPLWCRGKGAILSALRREFFRRGTCQGARLAMGRPERVARPAPVQEAACCPP
jgi:radical SAM protein (TIGR01212 family)